MHKRIASILQWLKEPTDTYVLGLFRILFGLAMIYVIIHYIQIDLVRNMFVLPKVNFRYDFLYWLKPLNEVGLDIVMWILLASAVTITIGFWFKWSCRIFAVGLIYIFLLDKSIYNNHIYLFILLAVLLSFTNSDASFSISQNRNKPDFVPRWQQFILQLQIAIVYFYGGIAKLTYDWIFNCQPVKFLAEQTTGSSLPVNNDLVIVFLTYGGFLLDFGAPFLLWNRKWRKWGIYPILLFNIINMFLFDDIGIFPVVMIICLLLFFDGREIPFLDKWIARQERRNNELSKVRLSTGLIVDTGRIPMFLIIYFSFQFLFPLRGHFLPNQLDWTTIGNRFSWRMKVDTRTIDEMDFKILDPNSKNMVPVEIHTFVNDMQILNMSMDPRSIRDFALMLKDEARKYGIDSTIVNASVMLRYNGRSPQPFVNSDIDISGVEYSPFKKMSWIFPLQRN